MKNSSTLLESLLKYKQVLYLSIAVAVITGILGLFLMPRDEYPQFRITQGLIVGIYPGASSSQVEEQLTKKVENYLFQYKAVDRSKTYSISKENVMIIYVEVLDSEKDPDAFWLKLRHGLNDLKQELPAGVISLTADNDFGGTAVMLLAVQSGTKTYKELDAYYVKELEKRLRRISSISKVKHYGIQKEQISIYVDDAKLANYSIRPLQLLAVLKPQSTIDYAGEIDDGKLVRPIHIESPYKAEEDIANQIVYADPSGNVIRVKDVARIVREYGDPDSYIRVNGKKCILVSVEMKAGSNVVSLGKDVESVVEEFTTGLPPDVRVIAVSDVPNAVSKSVNSFLKEFFIAIASVIFVTMLLLPARVASIAAISIPTSIFTALAIMWVAGIQLDSVSLAALIIVLGICVDDAMVIIDNYIEKLDEGLAPFDAGTKSVKELFSSVVSATLIIMSCFLPLPIFQIGPAGDFVRPMPYSISFALLASLGISVSLIPLINYRRIKSGVRGVKKGNGKRTFLDMMQESYDRMLEKAFQRKRTVIAVGIISFTCGIILFAITPQQAFPSIERNQFAAEVYLPEGSSLRQTDMVVSDIENILMKDKRVKVVTSFIGTSSPRFHVLYAPNFPAKNYGQIVVLTESNEAVEEIVNEYSKKLKGHYPLANIKWKQLAARMSKSPLEIRISGDDLRTIKETAERISDIVRKTPGTEFVRTDFREPLQSIDLAVKRDEVARLGYSNSMLGYSLMVGTKGLPVSTVWEGDYPVDVNLRIDKKVKSAPDDIRNKYLTTPFSNVAVPLRQVADVRAGWTEGQIVHRNGVRTITVVAETERGLVPLTVMKPIKSAVDKMKHPKGVAIEYGGEIGETEEIMTPLYYSLIVSVIAIFLILMLQYKKVKTSLVIMVTLPLSIFGAALGVFVMRYNFSLTAFVGLIGLLGIVVRNGVILVTYANELRHERGYSAEQAAIAAGKRRMRPIFLTSAAAMAGVIPMTLSRSPLWGPLGSVIFFGLLFALVLSLFVMPVVYYYFNRKDTLGFEEVAEESGK